MVRTACTELQCLYKGALDLYIYAAAFECATTYHMRSTISWINQKFFLNLYLAKFGINSYIRIEL